LKKIDAQLAEHFDLMVENYSGGKGRIPPLPRLQPTVRVCTMEKAAALVTTLLHGHDRLLARLGLVVADEVHLIGTARGVTLEDLLTKVVYRVCSGSSYPPF
jgi:hypothetical protein